MNNKLFVGGLSFNVTQQDLLDLFSQIGEVVSANVIMDKFTNKSKGFAFVEMSSAADAQKAVDQLNNTELQGRRITVNEARPQEDRKPGGFNNRNRY